MIYFGLVESYRMQAVLHALPIIMFQFIIFWNFQIVTIIYILTVIQILKEA